jgi:hypothetical protein
LAGVLFSALTRFFTYLPSTRTLTVTYTGTRFFTSLPRTRTFFVTYLYSGLPNCGIQKVFRLGSLPTMKSVTLGSRRAIASV